MGVLVKKLLFTLLLWQGMLCAGSVFEHECVRCHKEKNISLQKSFMNALLVYGGKENLKAGLGYYLRNPNLGTSVMDEAFLEKNGVKAAMKLSPQIMDRALEEYWQTYTVVGKLH